MEILRRIFGSDETKKPQSLKTDGEELGKTLDSMSKVVGAGHPEQHAIVGLMGKMLHRDIDQREVGYKEREPERQEKIHVFIKTQSGKTIGAWLGESEAKIVMPLGQFSKEKAFQVLKDTYTDFEPHTTVPRYFPKGWIDEDAEFYGLRKETGKPGDEVRGFWLNIREGQSTTITQNTLSLQGELQYYWLGWDSLVVATEAEVEDSLVRRTLDGNENPRYLNWYRMGQVPGNPGIEVQERLGKFLSRLLGDDQIESLSVKPGGWDVPMTQSDAKKLPGYHLEEKEKVIYIDKGNIKEKTEDTVDKPNWEYGKYIFKMGEDEYGILSERSRGYVIPYVFTKVKLYTEGLSPQKLQEEIERMRVI